MCIVYHITVSLFVMEIKTLFVRSFADKFKPASLRLLYQASIKLLKLLAQGSVDFKSYRPEKTSDPKCYRPVYKSTPYTCMH